MPSDRHDIKYLFEPRSVAIVGASHNSEKIGYKIREARMEKVPYMLILGDQEADTGTVALRDREDGDRGTVSLEDFVELVRDQMSPPAIPYKEE